MKHDISTLEQLKDFSKEFIDSLVLKDSGATLVTLSGDLGAGKTTFTQLLGKELGVETEITSPTYVIEQRYPITRREFKTLIHIDAYRLEQKDDALKIGLDQTLADPTNLVIIEWPEKIAYFLNEYEKTRITISLAGEGRVLSVE